MSHQLILTELADESLAFRQCRYDASGFLFVKWGDREFPVLNFSAFGIAFVYLDWLATGSGGLGAQSALVEGVKVECELIAHGQLVYSGEFEVVRILRQRHENQDVPVCALDVRSGSLPLEKLMGYRFANLTAAHSAEKIQALPEAFRLLELEFLDYLSIVLRSLDLQLDLLSNSEGASSLDSHLFFNALVDGLLVEIESPLDSRLGLMTRDLAHFKTNVNESDHGFCLRHLGRELVDRFGVNLLQSGASILGLFPFASAYYSEGHKIEKLSLAHAVMRKTLERYLSCASFTHSLLVRQSKIFEVLESCFQVSGAKPRAHSVLLICPVVTRERLISLGNVLNRYLGSVFIDIFDSDKSTLLQTQRLLHQWQLERKGQVHSRYFSGKTSEIAQFGLHVGYDTILIPHLLDSLEDGESYELLSLLFHHLSSRGTLVAGQYLPSEKTQNIFEVSGRVRPNFRTSSEIEQLTLPISGRPVVEENLNANHLFLWLKRTMND